MNLHFSESSSPSCHQNEINLAAKIEKAMIEMEYVGKAQDMGFDDETIKTLLERKYKANGQFYDTAEEFLDALFLFKGEPDIATNESPMGVEELRQLEESRTCKICRKEPSNTVVVPCGHLTMCETCAKSIKKCPLCHRLIKERIKTFRA